MISIKRLLFALTVLWAPLVLSALPEADLRLLLTCRSGNPESAKILDAGLSSKPAAIRFLNELKEPVQIGDETLLPGHRMPLLRNLGDLSALQEAYHDFSAKKNGEAKDRFFDMVLSGISHPAFIVVMGKDLDQPFDETTPGDAFEKYQTPFANARVIMRIVAKSGFFSPEAVRWANALGGDSDWVYPRTYLDSTRAFWVANREKIEAGDYEHVLPPGTIAKGSTLLRSSLGSDATSKAEITRKEPLAIANANQGQTERALSGLDAWIWGGGAVLFAAVLYIVFRRAK